MIIKVETYFEVIPRKKKAEIDVDIIKTVLKEEISKLGLDFQFDATENEDILRILQLSEEDAFNKITEKIKKK